MRLIDALAGRRTNHDPGRQDDPTSSQLLDARVVHVRHAGARHVLSHRVWYLRLPLDALAHLPWPWVGYNRAALATVRDSDYGRGASPLRAWIAEALQAAGMETPSGRIDLVTMPRVAGLMFNPVSFWMCRDPEGGLRAVLAEVNSTFGERHCYLCRRSDGGIITARDQITARKLLYVSPFLPVEGEYRFRFQESADRLGIFISLVQGGRTVMFASVTGRLDPLTARNVVARMARQPLPAARVLMLIHLHAARLWWRGLRILPRPRIDRPLVSVGQSTSIALSEEKCRPPATIEN